MRSLKSLLIAQTVVAAVATLIQFVILQSSDYADVSFAVPLAENALLYGLLLLVAFEVGRKSGHVILIALLIIEGVIASSLLYLPADVNLLPNILDNRLYTAVGSIPPLAGLVVVAGVIMQFITSPRKVRR